MEEGPEAHELLEQTEDAHDHGGHGKSGGRVMFGLAHKTRCAMLAAFMAALLGIASLFGGHAVTDAIITNTEASNAWSHYQAKSTRADLALQTGRLMEALGTASGVSPEKIAAAVESLRKENEKYVHERESLGEEARHLEAQKDHALKMHGWLSDAITCFTIGIVLSTVAILLVGELFFFASIFCALGGSVLLLMAFI